MQFSFSEEQQAFADSVHRFARQHLENDGLKRPRIGTGEGGRPTQGGFASPWMISRCPYFSLSEKGLNEAATRSA